MTWNEPMKQKSAALLAWPAMCLVCLGAIGFAAPAQAQNKPNILVIWGDDIGQSNISAYTMGLVGYRTPVNITRSTCHF